MKQGLTDYTNIVIVCTGNNLFIFQVQYPVLGNVEILKYGPYPTET